MSYNTKAHKNYTNNSKNSGIGGKWDNKCPHVQDLEKSELSKLQINLLLHLVQVPKVKLGIFFDFSQVIGSTFIIFSQKIIGDKLLLVII